MARRTSTRTDPAETDAAAEIVERHVREAVAYADAPGDDFLPALIWRVSAWLPAAGR